MDKMIIESIIQDAIYDEKQRQMFPCCKNCNSFYIEYGLELCKKNDEPMENTQLEKCNKWN